MSDQDDRIEELLDRWEEEFEGGNDISPETLCENDPDLVEQLSSKIQALRKMNGALADDTDGTLIDTDARMSPVRSVQVDAEFKVEEFIDRGGLGSIFGSTDRRLKRDAAIKFLSAVHAKNERRVRQFKTECEITSRLDHPGIVSVYGHGVLENGQPFYVMRRVSGDTLKERVLAFHRKLSTAAPTSEQRVEFHSLLSTFVAICQTIHYAHCRGVIHRDIKPANVMIGKHGETTVLDWGLATLVKRDEHLQAFPEATLHVTLDSRGTNSSAGTPMYMSPEQHAGTDDVGPRSDVYSLGATLLVLLTGESPFDGGSLPSLRKNVLRGQARNPKLKYRWMSDALISICRKAMNVHPSDRYESAEAMAQDVERYLADEPVEAHTESLLRRSSRWMSRHRVVTFVIASALIGGFLGSSLYSSLVTRLMRNERTARLDATNARDQSLRLASGFAANSVALQLNERWRIQEIICRDEEMIETLTEIDDNPESTDWAALQGLLLRFKEEFHEAAGHPKSWFICDATGRQVARVPPSSKSIGKNYSHRDYFHGNGLDVPPSVNENEARHIDDVHRSKVYTSTTDEELRVALSCPIWSDSVVTPDRRFLGILGMSVSLGEFEELQTGLGAAQRVVVVDLDKNVIEGVATEGLVLHHPLMNEGSSQRRELIDGNMLARLREIRNETRKRESEASDEKWKPKLIHNFPDPFVGESQSTGSHWIAAFSPVTVRGRKEDIADTGWGVLVLEREADDPGLFGFEFRMGE